ncbi:glycosyltransferase [Paractinoplanes maris]|uniref:glycosyltransferase n=1 Tax=Paractinoplanes maris TaxID=1734446 RepID=UPI0020211BC0|nr:glycosyltransferase [Actinoplanes maris]
MSERIHLIEAGGRGGVFQHSIAVASALSNAGCKVILHTARDFEIYVPGINFCGCFRWGRVSGNRVVRQALTAARLVSKTLPHLARDIKPGEIVYVQGSFGLTPEVVRALRFARSTIVCSPHNTFARVGAPGASRALRTALTASDRVLVFSASDRERLEHCGVPVGLVPLVQWVPPVPDHLTEKWRAELAAKERPLALLPGQVRFDKNPDLFVRAMVLLHGWTGAVVGEDKGAAESVDRLIAETGARIETRYGYLDMENFAALVRAADVVVAPYEVASQSGVLSVAHILGVPTAATPAGGLVEQATVVANSFEPSALAEAIKVAHGRGKGERLETEVAARYLTEFAAATEISARR